MAEPATITFESGASSGRVSGLLLRPESAWAAYVMAHGAGAGMRHPFLAAVADALAERGVATFRYQFPYMEIGKKRPDRPEVAQATVRQAVATTLLAAPGLPLVAGGKSFGGRMTSQAWAEKPLDSVLGLAFLGFPLHATGRPGVSRADHLARVHIPMLFLQGTRDSLAELELIRQVCDRIGGRATLSVLEGADHAFYVKGRGRKIDAELIEGLSDTIVSWARTLVEG